MDITKIQEIELPAAFDAHVHLRDGEMSQLVTPTIRKGGVNTVYVMVSLEFYVFKLSFQCFTLFLGFFNFTLFMVSLFTVSPSSSHWSNTFV